MIFITAATESYHVTNNGVEIMGWVIGIIIFILVGTIINERKNKH